MARQAHLYRNFGIIAHVDAGKTTLTERILYYTGLIHRMGEVHEGSTATDDSAISRRKGITVRAAAVTCHWRAHRLQLVDTPGHVDFGIEVERSLRVLDGAVVVLDGVAGVEPQTEAVWSQAERHGVPRLVFVNKLDRPGADLFACVESVRARLRATPVLLTLPIFDGPRLSGLVDLVSGEALCWPSDGDGASYTREPPSPELAAHAAPWRERLVYTCAEHDEAIADALLAGREIGADELRRALRRATGSGALVPVSCGSAYAKRGVQPLLDAIVDYLPSPLDRPPVRGTDGQRRSPLDTEPLAALVFKVMPTSAGALALVRVYSGTLAPKQTVACARTGARWRIGRVLRMFASRAEDVDGAGAGEIVAIAGPGLRTGDTVTDPERVITLEAMALPRPVVRLGLEAKTRDEHDRLGRALAKLVVEDPSLSTEVDAETGQLVLSGVGELQLETAIERLREEHQLDVAAGRPRVAYLETITRTVAVAHVHKKQTGGPGQWAELTLRLSPAERGAGLVFEDRTVGGALPAALVPAVRAGV
ncbi:GTP-binding protein, partial [Myxococcota bacterium]|nr:GTP-binding protein [Myxococcota bacterium]